MERGVWTHTEGPWGSATTLVCFLGCQVKMTFYRALGETSDLSAERHSTNRRKLAY